MTVPAALPFPGSRVLAGWWKDLRAYHPQSLAIAHVVLHRVEAPVRATTTVTVDRPRALLIRFLALATPAGGAKSLGALSPKTALLVGLLQGLARDGLGLRAGGGTRRPTPPR